MEYKIIVGTNVVELTNRVLDKVSEGFHPIGSPSEMFGYGAQAMIKYTATEPELPPTSEDPAITTRMLTVTKGNLPTSRANLRCVAKYNTAGYPRWKIFGGLPTSRRLRFFKGSQIEVYPGRFRADSGNTAYMVVPGQLDSFGKRVPDTIELYVLKKDVA